jgi:hypothetical protein
MKTMAQFGRVALVLGALVLGAFAVLPEGSRAQTACTYSGSAGTCMTLSTNCPSGNAGPATVCGEANQFKCCVSGSSSTCKGTCKDKCLNNEKEESSDCSSKCREKDVTKPLSCVSTGTDGGGSGSSSVSITLPNPLKYDTVQEVLTALLYALQGVIVVLSLVFIVIGAVLYITSGGRQSQVTAAKLAITAALIGLAIGILAPTFLKEIATVLGWGGTVPPEVSGAKSAADILLSVLNFLLGIVGILAIIFLVIGGIMFLGAAGDMNRIGVAKKIVTFALLGIVVALASLVIVRQIAEFFAPATT